MNPHFRDLLTAMKETADAFATANAALTRAVEAALASNDEHEDLRETVHRLESLIEDLVRRLPPPS